MYSDSIQASHADISGAQSRDRVLVVDKVSQIASNPHPDSIDAIVAQVLEIIPDVSPDHALSLTQKYYAEYGLTTHEMVLHTLFEDPNYPKVISTLFLFSFIGWSYSQVPRGRATQTEACHGRRRR